MKPVLLSDGNRIEPLSTSGNIFFAGGEAWFDMLYDMGVRKILMSYLYLKQKKIKDIGAHFKLDKREPIIIMIDSGAFTLRADEGDEKKSDEYYEKYVQRYCRWIQRNKRWIHTAVEIDIDNVVGKETVERWRKQYFAPLEKEGVKIVYVWHFENGLKEWTRMCSDFKYIGIGSSGKLKDPGEAMRYINKSRRAKVSVHGFAFTKPTFLVKVPFTTVDSTSWLSGMQYGTTFFFDGNKFLTLNKTQKHLRKQFKRKWQTAGLDWSKLQADDPYEITKANIWAWLQVEKYIQRRLRARAGAAAHTSNSSEPGNDSENRRNPLAIPEVGGAISLLDDPSQPRLKCSTCYIGEDCPKYDESRTTCAFSFGDIPVNSTTDLQNLRRHILKTNISRAQLQLAFEQMGGGALSRDAQQLLDTVDAQAKELLEERVPNFPPPPSGTEGVINGTERSILSELFGKVLDKLPGPEPQEEPKPVVIIDQPARSDVLPPAEPITPHQALRLKKSDVVVHKRKKG